MSRDEQAIDKEIVDKGKTAPRITPDRIDGLILSEHFLRGTALCTDENGAPLPDTLKTTYEALSCLTICTLVLANGFTVTGTSACASPENFDEAIGRRLAREKAREQIWALEGYRLRCSLSERAAQANPPTPSA